MDDGTPRGSESMSMTPTSNEASPGSLFKVPMPPMPMNPQEFGRESSCGRCHKMFTLLRRRHHCRGCHVAICNNCGRKAVDHRRGDNVKPQWYCCKCVDREEDIEAVGRMSQLSKKSSSNPPPLVLTVPKFCIECGYELPPRVKFCIQCGSSVRAVMTSPQATERVPAVAEERDRTDSSPAPTSKLDESPAEEPEKQDNSAPEEETLAAGGGGDASSSELETQVVAKSQEVAKLHNENLELKRRIEQLTKSLAEEKARPKSSVDTAPSCSAPAQQTEQPSTPPTGGGGGGVKARDHPDFLKFFKLLSMGLPPEQVKMKMQQAGVNPAVLDTPDAIIGGSVSKEDSAGGAPVSVSRKTVKDDERYAKFFKLLKMGMPPPQIKLKMSAEGLDPNLLDTPDAIIDGGGSGAAAASSAPSVMKVADDPAFAKFFKLVKMGLPAEQVKLKMKAEGLDPNLLDQPDAPSPNQASGASAGGAAAGGILGGLPPKVDAVKVDESALKASLASKLQLGKQPSKKKVEEPQLPKKEVVKPNVELRPLFWTRVPVNVVSSTVWMKLSDSHASFDVQEMEWIFRKNPVDDSKQKRKESNSDAKDASPQLVLLLDPKRQQNVGIAIARLRMPATEIKSAIYALDETRMGSEMLNVLISIAPTLEEQDLLKNYTGDEKLLGNAEKFFLEMLSIPRFTQRIKCFRFKMQFETRILETQAQLDTLVAATEQISDSEKLRKVLEHILALGNYLNGNTPRGGAYGFKLDTLTKLHTLKSVEPRLTLMHFLLRQLEERNPEVIAFAGELPHVSDAKRLSLDQLRTDINAYNSELAMLQGQVRASKADQIAEDKFYEIMSPFSSDAAEVLDEMSKEFSTLESSYSELVGSFGEDPRTVGPIEFFTIMEEFVNEFKKAYRQNQTKEFQTIWTNINQARLDAEAEAKAKAEAEAQRKREEEAEAKAKAESLNPDEAKEVYGQVIALIQSRAKKRGEDYGSAIDQFKLTSRKFGVDEITADEFCEAVRRIVGTKTALKIIPDSAKLLAHVGKRKDLLIAYDKFSSKAKAEQEAKKALEALQKQDGAGSGSVPAKAAPKHPKASVIKVQDIEPVVGEAAQQLHRSILDSVQQAFNNDTKKMKIFTSNARKYGSEQITAREFYQYLTASFDPDFVARLVPDLARLLQDAEKRHALLRALCESAPGWEKFSGL